MGRGARRAGYRSLLRELRARLALAVARRTAVPRAARGVRQGALRRVDGGDGKGNRAVGWRDCGLVCRAVDGDDGAKHRRARAGREERRARKRAAGARGAGLARKSALSARAQNGHAHSLTRT